MINLSRSLMNRLLLAGLAVGIVVACANIARPTAHAQVMATCTPSASYPCATCQGTDGSYQCLPGLAGYQWGYCGGKQTNQCYLAMSPCYGYNCQSPPSRKSNTGCTTTMSYSSCQ